jgi:hypothetical protein
MCQYAPAVSISGTGNYIFLSGKLSCVMLLLRVQGGLSFLHTWRVAVPLEQDVESRNKVVEYGQYKLIDHVTPRHDA